LLPLPPGSRYVFSVPKSNWAKKMGAPPSNGA
jgi:hypothetical protein